jgi:hypothetical protein
LTYVSVRIPRLVGGVVFKTISWSAKLFGDHILLVLYLYLCIVSYFKVFY